MHYMLVGHKIIKTNDLFEWAEWFQNSNRTIGNTVVGNDVKVSTVFLGLDHNFSGEGEPILFETMIFGGIRDCETIRYSTWDQALFGHNQIVKEFSQRCSYCGTLRIKDHIKCSSCGGSF